MCICVLGFGGLTVFPNTNPSDQSQQPFDLEMGFEAVVLLLSLLYGSSISTQAFLLSLKEKVVTDRCPVKV